LRVDAGGGTRIAWDIRQELGRINALWLTCVQGIFRVKSLERATWLPVDSRSAVLFRLIVSAAVMLPLCVLFLIVVHLNQGTGFLSMWTTSDLDWGQGLPSGWELTILWSAGATLLPIVPAGALIAVYLGTGVLGYWVKTHEMSDEPRRRAVAVSRYVAAPLILAFVPISAYACAALSSDLGTVSQPMRLFGFLASVVIAGTYGVNAIKLISAVTHCGWMRRGLSILGILICWALAAVVGLGIFPAVAGLLRIMVDSLRR